MIILDRPDLSIKIELKPDPPNPAEYVELSVEDHEDTTGIYCRLTAAEAITLADALHVAAMKGRLIG